MNHKIEILSESLDKINIGTIPEAEDQELSDLLEVAALLRNDTRALLKGPVMNFRLK